MPAEWETQAAIWLSWPSNHKLWPGYFTLIPAKFAEFVATISRFEPVHINCIRSLQAAAIRELNAARADLSLITLHDHPTDDVWCRDHGPIFVKNKRTGEVAITDWVFRGWGGKFEASLDNQIPARIAETLRMRRFSTKFELEGGAIETNGTGQLLTTRAVQNNPNRAKGRNDTAFHNALRNMLGIDEILWLDGGLANDDTDGHIDNLTRFFHPGGLITVIEPDPARPNHLPLAKNLERLRSMRTRDGKPFDIVTLPLPAPFNLAGRDLPPSYANFLIINGAVIAPIYNQPGDARALGILAEVFPNREIIGIDCRLLLIEGGALHCLSQQQPA
ncbi:MAG: agmatine deiminase family protein [Puniceicoccales bacterium]|nr:agmatine deiminase family protein [Puniceicoccales bacterium]